MTRARGRIFKIGFILLFLGSLFAIIDGVYEILNWANLISTNPAWLSSPSMYNYGNIVFEIGIFVNLLSFFIYIRFRYQRHWCSGASTLIFLIFGFIIVSQAFIVGSGFTQFGMWGGVLIFIGGVIWLAS